MQNDSSFFELTFVKDSTVFMLSFGNYNLHLHHTQNELKTSYRSVNRLKWKKDTEIYIMNCKPL